MKELNKEIIYEEFFKQNKLMIQRIFRQMVMILNIPAILMGVCDMTKRLLRLLDKLNS